MVRLPTLLFVLLLLVLAPALGQTRRRTGGQGMASFGAPWDSTTRARFTRPAAAAAAGNGGSGDNGGSSSITSTSTSTSSTKGAGGQSPHNVVASFNARVFDPAPLLRNPHFQTIWGARAIQDALLRTVTPAVIPTKWSDVYDRRERFETPDQDFFHADWLYASASAHALSCEASVRPVAIVLHGLESTSTALLPRSMAKAFARRGFDVMALNFRGCCGNDNLQPFAYHLGWTDDLILVIRWLHEEDPRRRIYLTGFSLGGNVILKSLGELGEDAIRLGVKGAALACVPFDAVRSSGKIDGGFFNRQVYAGNFLSTLKVKAARKHEQHRTADGTGPYDLDRVLACSSIGDFDDEVIAKLHGFEDKIDYYTQSCCKQYLPRVRVPALVVQALDDPFIDERGLPTQADVGPAPIRLVYHAHGGHCGFIDGREGPSMPEEDRWLPSELARFLEHVDAPFRGEGEGLQEVRTAQSTALT